MIRTYDDYKELVIKLHEYFYREVCQYQDYMYTPSASDESSIKNFIENYIWKEHGENAAIEYIINFFESSYNYWVEERQDTFKYSQYGFSSIKLSWIIGKKAIKRYEKIKIKDSAHWSRFKRYIRSVVGTDVLDKFGVERDAKVITDTSFLTKVNTIEEGYKERFHNTEQGFLFCRSMTTLYFHKSEHCVLCKFKQDCKALLKDNWPKLYKKRGYE